MKKTTGYDTLEQVVLGNRDGDPYAFALLVHQWYLKLCFLAKRLIDQARMAETIVEQALVALWVHRQELEEVKAVKRFLFYSIRQACLECIRKEQGPFMNVQLMEYVAFESLEFIDQELALAEVLRQLQYDPIENLPALCLEAISPELAAVGKKI
ncbi:MAG: sigma factor [Candidatus Pseudobacter hemicellulosilyticus]|uniref:Sigma factor n=1 Tax=Candidatus Pseudobacter hemicellulosilyticus TaxID=3121375 RepID=A0AAJ5WX97_9BACT|nr:MAG: sigma factor [Pseudobacter sp.]